MQKLITTLAVVLVATAAVHADTLAAWDATGSDGISQAATTIGAGMTAGSLAAGPGLQANVSWPNSVNTYADWQISPSLEYAVDVGNDYFSFTVAPDAGQTANYDNIFTRFVMNAGSSDASMNYTLMSSQTGFTTNSASILGSLNIATLQAVEGYNPSVHETDFDVSGVAALQNVATSTEFRIYLWKDYGGNRLGIGKTWSAATGDDLRVDGTVIPEPATLSLLGFAAGGMFWFRKRYGL